MCFMKIGEKTWFPKALRCCVCWISRVATSLCLRESLRVCPLDRLVLALPTYFWNLGALLELLPLFTPALWSCSQAFWAPGDTGVVFVGWQHEPFRLGVRFCTNRR